MKLLMQLRNLKLSLMGILSLLTSAKADYMMDALGIVKPSVFGGGGDDVLSEETMRSIEDTKRKLAGLSAADGQLQSNIAVGHEIRSSSRTTLVQRERETHIPMSTTNRPSEISNLTRSMMQGNENVDSAAIVSFSQDISTMLSPSPVGIMQHDLGSVQSFHTVRFPTREQL